jgi:hypothetical protein
MISLAQLWIPILVSAVGVFIASSLIHMVFKWHNSDYHKLPNEDAVRAALGKPGPAPGQYVIPHCPDMKDMQKPEVQQKFKDGPVGLLLFKAPGMPNMGPMLGQWFALNLAVAFLVAYLACKTLLGGAAFLAVCRVTGTVTFLAYAVGSVSDGIWFFRPWRAVAKDLLDAAIYATVTAIAFASLWPN